MDRIDLARRERALRTAALTMPPRRRLLTIAHSYAVALNRRLAHELARVGVDRWSVTAVAPRFLHGDLRAIRFEPHPDDGNIRLEVLPFHLSRRIHLAWYGRGFAPILREPWDLVHCWEEPYVVAGFQVARRTARACTLVYATHQNISKRYPPPFNWFEQYALARCAGWTSCGQTATSVLRARGYDAVPHRAIPLGVDLEHFRPDAARRQEIRRRLAWSEAGAPVVGYLGRFNQVKGVDRLMRILDATRSPWRALFVGGGPLEPALRAWGARWSDRVRVATEVPHDDVPMYLNAMDLLCAPSQTTAHWREQQGRMLVEAFACGVPVVGSDSGEIPVIVGNAGRVVSEDDERAWVDAVTQLVADPPLRQAFVERGLARARAFSWPNVAREHLQFFDELVERRALEHATP